ncbi:MAG: D-glycero-beta-D-manno-heptose 1-phosphate adenylyltransferase [Candidatus Hydrogenedentota bacterium]
MIVSRNNIRKIVKKLKNRGKSIVFTNGCFDIIHPGHIKVLSEAKKLGDCLIVGLNSDSSVKKLKKGEKRPLQNFRARSCIIDSIKYVDYVVCFSELTPYNLIKEIQPDIIVKGGDYREDNVVGREIVKKLGGKVVIVALKKGHSTTAILQRYG